MLVFVLFKRSDAFNNWDRDDVKGNMPESFEVDESFKTERKSNCELTKIAELLQCNVCEDIRGARNSQHITNHASESDPFEYHVIDCYVIDLYIYFVDEKMIVVAGDDVALPEIWTRGYN